MLGIEGSLCCKKAVICSHPIWYFSIKGMGVLSEKLACSIEQIKSTAALGQVSRFTSRSASINASLRKKCVSGPQLIRLCAASIAASNVVPDRGTPTMKTGLRFSITTSDCLYDLQKRRFQPLWVPPTAPPKAHTLPRKYPIGAAKMPFH